MFPPLRLQQKIERLKDSEADCYALNAAFSGKTFFVGVLTRFIFSLPSTGGYDEFLELLESSFEKKLLKRNQSLTKRSAERGAA
jgi:hypothetical protein